MYGSAGPRDLPDGGDDYRRADALGGSIASPKKRAAYEAAAARAAAKAAVAIAARARAAAKFAEAEAKAEATRVAVAKWMRVAQPPRPAVTLPSDASGLVRRPAVVCPPPSPHDEADSITLVTQCSAARLPKLAAQLRAWRGPASVALFIDAPEGSARAAEV